MIDRPALIIGAGIAGPAVAAALVRAGIPAAVCEASPVPRDDAGVFLNVAPNGLAALRAIGLDSIVEGLGFRNDRLVFLNDAGRVLAEVEAGGITVMRGALSRALRRAAEGAGVPFAFGKSLASIADEPGAVLARFDDGSSANGSCLIGADGIHSRTRTIRFPGALRPAYTGIINLGGVVHTRLPPTGSAMHMVFGRRAFFGYAVRPSGETYWFSNFAQKEAPAPGWRAHGDPEALRRELLELHRHDPPEVEHILSALSGDIGVYPIYDLPSQPAWQRGAVCLIGDAAHAVGPHVGQGASLALEDASILAECLHDARTPAEAFVAFEQLRRERVEAVFRYSRRTGRQKAPTGWLARKVRDLMLPWFLGRSAEAARKLYERPA